MPPKLVRGRTHKGDKLEPQKPKQYGPFTLTANMSWTRFLTEVSATVDIELENLDLTEMTWCFQKKAQLMLTSVGGYKAMIQQILALKDPSAAIIIVSLPAPKRAHAKGGQKYQQESDEDFEELNQLDEDTKWGKKLSLDDQLAPIVHELEEKYPPGICDEHREISCFHYCPKGWHFHLDRNRIKVWANAIVGAFLLVMQIIADMYLKLRKVTDITKPPLGQNFFLPKDRIGSSLNTRSTTSAINTVTPTTPSLTPAPAWHGFYPYPSPSMMGFPLPMPWSYPQTPTPPGYPQMLSYNFGTPTPQGQPMPYYNGTPGPTIQLNTYPSTEQTRASASASPSEVSVHEWCAHHKLGDAERRGLIKLGFIVGETASLAALPMDMWEWAGLGPLHRQRILAACAASATT
ncbi:hypothetical protein C0992_005365 [Termitomyces sp. T32_za158]|nr:hypothetical protein C0992_005365 [Termitomyces sp. T32_za158]